MIRLFPLLGVLLYESLFWFTGKFRPDHILVGVCLLAVFYLGSHLQRVRQFAFPFLLVGVVYDTQRFYADLIRGTIHVAQPYLFDKAFFGITTPRGILTPNEWWQLHLHPALDLLSGFFYLNFISLFVLIAAYFCFGLSRNVNTKLPAHQVHEESMRMPWAFFWLNVLGYSTYYWYAAAPPWYVAEHGLGPANLQAHASAAGAIRFDQLMGTHFFSGMYGRAADVFGAIPSLHVAYPLLAVYYAFRFGSLRVSTIVFYLIMCFSAIYLNHHYVLDILWGSVYALGIGRLTNVAYELKKSSEHRINSLLAPDLQ